MFVWKEVFILIFAITVIMGNNRPKRDVEPLMIGSEIPGEPVKSTVAIIRKNDQYGQPFCSGTLISNTMVLAAAHCFEEHDLTNIQVVAGEMNMVWGTKGVTRGVKSLKKHPDYKFILDKRNDREHVQLIDGNLALLELDQPLDLENNDNIVKAELPTLSMKLTNKLIQIGGWTSNDFLSINITVKPNKECSETFDQGTYFPDRMLCAGLSGQTSCKGDQGGALFHGWGVPIVVGIVSHGVKTCTTVYTRVDKYLPWIFSQTDLKSPFVYLAEEETWLKMRDNLLQDLSQPRTVLYLSDSKVVSVPSFAAVEGCPLPPYPEAGVGGAVSGVVNNRLFVCGGVDENNADLSSCYSLDHGRWWLQQPLNSKRYHAAASLSPLGLMVTGGWSGRILSSTEVLSPTGWIPGPALPEPVSSHCQISIGSVVIIIGGDIYATLSAAAYALDKDKNTWTPLAGMQNARRGHACIVLGNNIVVMGGVGATTSVEFYDLLEDEWTTGPDLDREMAYGHATVHDDRLFAIFKDGLVMEMAGDRTAWIETEAANIGAIGPYRPVFPAPLLTEEMLGC